MKFPVGRVGMSHRGLERRGRIFPSLQQVLTSRCALRAAGWGDCHPCPCYWEKEVMFSRCNAPDGSHGQLELMVKVLPSLSQSTQLLTPASFYRTMCFFSYQCWLSLAWAVFSLCSLHVASSSASHQVSPGGQEDSGCYQLRSCQEVWDLPSHFMKVFWFLSQVRCQSTLENCVYVKALKFPMQFLLKSKKNVYI